MLESLNAWLGLAMAPSWAHTILRVTVAPTPTPNSPYFILAAKADHTEATPAGRYHLAHWRQTACLCYGSHRYRLW